MTAEVHSETQMTVDQLVTVARQVQEAGAGDTPVAVNVGGHLVLPVLRSAVRFSHGQSYLEMRAPEPSSSE